MSTAAPAVDWVFFRRLWFLFKLLTSRTIERQQSSSVDIATTTNKPRWTPSYITLLLILLLTSSVILEVIVYLSGVASSGFYSVLADRNWDGFVTIVVKCFVLYEACAALKSLRHYLGGLVALQGRLKLTTFLQAQYVDRCVFFTVNQLEKKSDFGSDAFESTTSSVDDANDSDDSRITANVDGFGLHNIASGKPNTSLLLDNPDQTITQDVDKFTEEVGHSDFRFQ
jgi:ABC-type uncharacterized transport system fused permease/ATPase subunit